MSFDALPKIEMQIDRYVSYFSRYLSSFVVRTNEIVVPAICKPRSPVQNPEISTLLLLTFI
jgi:hypothetical protein